MMEYDRIKEEFIWITKDKRKVPVREMSVDHILNTMALLRLMENTKPTVEGKLYLDIFKTALKYKAWKQADRF